MTEEQKRVYAILCRAEDKAFRTLQSWGQATFAANYAERFENYEEIWARAHCSRLAWEQICSQQ